MLPYAIKYRVLYLFKYTNFRSTFLGEAHQIRHEWIFQEFNFVQSLPPLITTGYAEHPTEQRLKMKKSNFSSLNLDTNATMDVDEINEYADDYSNSNVCSQKSLK